MIIQNEYPDLKWSGFITDRKLYEEFLADSSAPNYVDWLEKKLSVTQSDLAVSKHLVEYAKILMKELFKALEGAIKTFHIDLALYDDVNQLLWYTDEFLNGKE